MVATFGVINGERWQLAPCLQAAFVQLAVRYPGRDTSSDGTIGDGSHAVRVSDHNPDESGPIDDVLASDFTHDPAHGFNSYEWAEYLRSVRDKRIKYVISNSRFFTSYAKGDRKAWEWAVYSGSPNPHTKHIHISVLDTLEAKNDLSPWLPPQEGNSNTPATPIEDDMIAAWLTEIRAAYQYHANREADTEGLVSWAKDFAKKEAAGNIDAALDGYAYMCTLLDKE